MVRVSVNLTEAQADALQKRAAETGVRKGEQIRRALDAALGEEKRPVPARVLLAMKSSQ